ncbi:MAG: 30S ribosomal protein S4 [Oligoflexia bacterium]|nr:30S ribosomal protein S4 [Oligoflexia bacterium]
MSRSIKHVCKLCRRENLKLFLKGDRCFTDKCSFERRPYPPGQHGQSRMKFSEYALQLREKQKVKRLYGIFEKQFRRYFKESEQQKGVTGTTLLLKLERRLDNVVFLLGYAASRNEAKQLVKHSHVMVNGRKANMPSYEVKKGDVIEIHEKSRGTKVQAAIESAKRREASRWLEAQYGDFKGMVKDLPARDDVTTPIEEHMVVEYYSR